MFILIDIICVASLVYLYIEKRNEKKKMQAQHSSNVLNPLVPQAPRLCGIFVSPCFLRISPIFPPLHFPLGINPLAQPLHPAAHHPLQGLTSCKTALPPHIAQPLGAWASRPRLSLIPHPWKHPGHPIINYKLLNNYKLTKRQHQTSWLKYVSGKRL